MHIKYYKQTDRFPIFMVVSDYHLLIIYMNFEWRFFTGKTEKQKLCTVEILLMYITLHIPTWTSCFFFTFGTVSIVTSGSMFYR